MDSRWTGAGAAVSTSPPPRGRNPDHPPYAEMVRAALLAQAENGGSTEAVISSYIVSAYPGIPPGHPRLLPYYLRKLVTARELSVSPSGRYLLPDSCPCESSAPPPSPKLNALLSPNPSFVLRLRKSISGEDGSGLKVGWCYAGDGSTSSPSVTDQQSGSAIKKSGGESYPPIPDSIQAEPEKALLPPSPVWDPNMEGMSPILGLDEHKELLTGPSPIKQQLGSESSKQDGELGSDAKKPSGELHPPVQGSMLTGHEKAPLPPSPSLVSDLNLESIILTLGLAFMSPTNKQLSESESRKHDGESGCEAKKRGGESYLLVPASIQAEPEKELVPSSPISGPNMEDLSQTLGLGPDDPKESLSPFPVSVPNMEVISPTLVLNDSKELLVVASPVDKQQLGSEDGGLHPSIPVSMQIVPGEALLPPSPSPLRDTFLKCTSLDKPKESSLASIANQQSGSESEKQHGDSNLLTPGTMQVEPEREPLLPNQPITDPNMEWTSQVLGLDELKESSSVSHTITEQQSGSDPRKHDGESHSSAPDSMQAYSKEVLSLPPAPPVSGRLQTKPDPRMPAPLNPETNGGWSSLALTLDELKEPLAVPTPIANKQSGIGSNKEDMDSHPPNLALMQTETGKEPPVSGRLQTKPDPRMSAPLNPETNAGWSSLALTLDELKEPLAVPTPIANKQSGTGSNKEDMDSHPPNLALMQTETGKEPSPPPISMQLQAEPEPKLSSPDYVPEKPSLALGEKKSLSGKPRPKRRRL